MFVDPLLLFSLYIGFSLQNLHPQHLSRRVSRKTFTRGHLRIAVDPFVNRPT